MRGWKAALGAAVAGVVAGPSGFIAPTAEAQDPELAPVERFASCVNGGGQGNVLMLFDTSGSLYNTDRDGGRVKAAKATVDRLAESLTAVQGAQVDLAVAGGMESISLTINKHAPCCARPPAVSRHPSAQRK